MNFENLLGSTFFKYLLYLFLFAFFYRLVRNLSRLIRANHYLKVGFDKYGKTILTSQVPVYRLISDAKVSINLSDLKALILAKEIFIMKIKENFSPFFWLESIALLPEKIFNPYGRTTKKKEVAEKIFTVIWWVLTFVIGLYGEEIKLFISSFLKRF